MFRRDLRTVIDINAPPTRVWEVLSDTEGYAEWNPMVRALTCPKGLFCGAPVSLHLHVRGLSLPPIPAKISRFDIGRVLAWKGGIPGLQTGEHYFIVEQRGAHSRLIHGERWAGVAVAPTLTVLAPTLFASYRQLNAALAQRCLAA